MNNPNQVKTKRAGALATKWFGLRWKAWLADGEKIATSSWTIPAASGLTESSSSNTDTTASIKLAGGNVGTWELLNTITTSAPLSQTETRSLWIKVE